MKRYYKECTELKGIYSSVSLLRNIKICLAKIRQRTNKIQGLHEVFPRNLGLAAPPTNEKKKNIEDYVNCGFELNWCEPAIPGETELGCWGPKNTDEEVYKK